MRGNTVTIEMPLKRGKVSKTIPLYQYDYGQKLLFTGIELPAYYEVHFSNEMHGEATTKIGTSEGVDIPDVYLSTGEPVYLWLYLHSEVTDGETEFQGSIPVIKRASISDQTPTEQEATVIAEAIVALNEAAEALDGAVESAEAAQEGAEAAEDGAEEQALKAEGYAIGKHAGEDVDSSSPYYHNNAKYYNDQAGSSATAASGSATAASGSASSAESWATGGSSGTPSATNNAKYYSEQAASSASTANSAKSDAVSAKNTAATWATGGTTGTPSATNNAKYYSDQAAESAEAAANMIDDTAGEGDTGKAWSADKLVAEFAEKYEKPSGGIPSSDMASAVQTSLGKADSAYQKPAGGIPASDLASGVIPVITGKADKVASATSGNFAGLDSNGNLTDSGHKHSDYLTAHQDITGKADKVSGATSGNFAGLDSNGNLTDSGKSPSDLIELDADLEDSTKAAPADVVGQLALMKTDHIYNETEPSAICSVSDGAALPIKTLSISIEPVQEGSGDPSPENVRPISGWDSAEVSRTGKNLLPNKIYQENSYRIQLGISSMSEYVHLKAGTYKLSYGVKSGITGASIFWKKRDEQSAHDSSSITLQDDADLRIWIFKEGIETTDILWWQIELGSIATSYEPYSGTTAEYAFPEAAGTVYGGTLTIHQDGTGELVVDRANIASYNGETLPSTWISDRDVYAQGTTPTTGAQVVYELATPVTYQLTNQQVVSLLQGQNVVFADCGDVSLEYPADTKLYIDGKIAEIQALILENISNS